MTASIRIGIIREGRQPVDKRAPFTPDQCAELLRGYPQLSMCFQPSVHRCFTDDAYTQAGLTATEDLSTCDVIFGIKEIPIDKLIPDKTHFFFSHTLKKQAHNRGLLAASLQKKIRLIDYECIKDTEGNRLIAFGYFAGLVGAYNGLLTWGKKAGSYTLKPMHQCANRTEAEAELAKLKLPQGFRIAVTGGGRVGGGIVEMLTKAGIKRISPDIWPDTDDKAPAFCVFHTQDIYAHTQGLPFDKEAFRKDPSPYRSTFGNKIKDAHLLIAGAYWDPRADRLFTSDVLLQPHNLSVVADITCDIGGSIPVTVRASTIENPLYDYNPADGKDYPALSQPDYITVMAVDNLPCEMAADASVYFGDQLIQKVLPDLVSGSESELLQKATICRNGALTPQFSYLSDYAAVS